MRLPGRSHLSTCSFLSARPLVQCSRLCCDFHTNPGTGGLGPASAPGSPGCPLRAFPSPDELSLGTAEEASSTLASACPHPLLLHARVPQRLLGLVVCPQLAGRLSPVAPFWSRAQSQLPPSLSPWGFTPGSQLTATRRPGSGWKPSLSSWSECGLLQEAFPACYLWMLL